MAPIFFEVFVITDVNTIHVFEFWTDSGVEESKVDIALRANYRSLEIQRGNRVWNQEIYKE